MRYCLIFLFFLSSLFGAASFDPGNMPQDIFVNNRVLLKVNGKTITVLDVVHKMDLLFYRQFADLSASSLARYQFYLASWKNILTTVIDDQLILADAKEKQVEITAGEIREELEKLFGPDVVINIHKMQMTFDEVWEMLKTELTVQRMIGMMVHLQAQTEVNPKKIRERYEEMLKENPPQASWTYQVLTLRGPQCKEVADEAASLLSHSPESWEELPLRLTKEGIQVSLSENYERTENDLSAAHKTALQNLRDNAFSEPVFQGQEQARIFFVKKYAPAQALPIQEMEESIRGELIQIALMHHNKLYREKLRKNYGLSESELVKLLPKDQDLFALR